TVLIAPGLSRKVPSGLSRIHIGSYLTLSALGSQPSAVSLNFTRPDLVTSPYERWNQEIEETPVHWRRRGDRRDGRRGRVRDAQGRIPRGRRVTAGDGRARHDGQVRGRHRQGRTEHENRNQIESER